MGKALIALKSAPRRKLQVLAMEMKLCRGNAKSEVILSHALQFLGDHPKDGEQQMLDVLSSIESTSSPTAKAVEGKRVMERDMEPEAEPDGCVKESKVTASTSASNETVQLTPTGSKQKKTLKRKHSPITTTASKKSMDAGVLPCESSSGEDKLVTPTDTKKMKTVKIPSPSVVKKSKIKQMTSPANTKKSMQTTASLAESSDSKKKLVVPTGTKKETAKSKKALSPAAVKKSPCSTASPATGGDIKLVTPTVMKMMKTLKSQQKPSPTVVKKASQTTASPAESTTSETNEVMPSDAKTKTTKHKQKRSPTVAKKSKIEHTPSPTVIKKSSSTTPSPAKNASNETNKATTMEAKMKKETTKRKQTPSSTVVKKRPSTAGVPFERGSSDNKLVTPADSKKKKEVQTPSPTVVKKSTTTLPAAISSSETNTVTPANAKKKETLESKQTPSPTAVKKSKITQTLCPAAVTKSPPTSASPAVSTSETNKVATLGSKKKTTNRKQTLSPTLVKTSPSTTTLSTASTGSGSNAVMPMDAKKHQTMKSKQRLSPTVSTKTLTYTTLSTESLSPSQQPMATPTKALPAAINQRPTAAAKMAALEEVKPIAAPIKTVASVSKKTEIKPRETVEALVQSTPDLTFIGDSRVRCSTTGHEMVADVNVIKMYLQGKRYQKARNLKLSFAKYAPMFVDHPDELKTDMLWCNVTESAIARDEKRVKDHIGGSKYQSQLSIWKEQEAATKKKAAEAKEARIQAAKKRKLTGNAIGGNPARNKRRKRPVVMKSDK